MARETTTEDAELKRLQSLAVSPDYKERKSRLFAQQVAALAELLEPEVRRGLKKEVQGQIADEWVEEGRAALSGALAESPKDWLESREFLVAIKSIRDDLARYFGQGALMQNALEPNESEIQSHTAELAQCVLANWLALLEHAKQDADSNPVALTANALPESIEPAEMYEGTEAFVLEQSTVGEKFNEYLDTLTKLTVAELAPSLVLATTEKGMWLTSSIEEAEELVERFLNPVIGSTELNPAMVQSLAQAVAYQALGIERYGEEEPLDEGEEQISIKLADVAVTALKLTVGETRLKTSELVQMHLAKTHLGSTVHEVLPKSEEQSLYHFAMAATWYAASNKSGMHVIHASSNAGEVENLLRSNEAALKFFRISSEAVARALGAPGMESISTLLSMTKG